MYKWLGDDPVWNALMPHAQKMEPSPLDKRRNWRASGNLPDSGIGNMSDLHDLGEPCIKRIHLPTQMLQTDIDCRTA